jgi:hypothetical protein
LAADGGGPRLAAASSVDSAGGLPPPPTYNKQYFEDDDYGVLDNSFFRKWVPASKQAYETWDKQISNKSASRVPFDQPNYLGGFMLVNDEDDPFNSKDLRSDTTKGQIRKWCDDVKAKMGGQYNLDEWNDSTDITQTIAGWGLGVMPNGSIKPTHNRKSLLSVAGMGETYGGPCSWCRPGQGAWIPSTTPRPWTSSSAPQGDQETLSPATLSSSFFEIRYKMQELGLYPYEMNPKLCGVTIGCASALTSRVPIARQPNGGWQLLLREAGTNKCWVYYFDAAMTYFARFFLEATDIGGIVAYDNGTVITVSQPDCDGPPTTNMGGGNMNRAVVLCWRDGVRKWAKRLTDPYRKQDPNNKTAVGASIDNYIDDPTGNGQFVTNMYFARMKGNSDNQIGVCVQQTGGTLAEGGNHWGSVVYFLDADTGKITEQHFACSHDIGGRICAKAKGFVHVCAEDGVGGRGINVTCGGAGACPAFSGDESNKHFAHNGHDEAGWAASRIRSLIPRNDGTDGFVLAFLNKKDKKLNDIVVRLFDPNMQASSEQPIVILKNNSADEYFNLHLAPFGGKTGRYLMYHETLKDPVCRGNSENEARCYGPMKSRTWQLVQQTGASFQPVPDSTAVQQSGNNVRMNYEDDPVVCPDGAIVWATFKQSKVVFYRLAEKSSSSTVEVSAA